MAGVELLEISEVEEIEVFVDGDGGTLQLLKCRVTLLHSHFLDGMGTEIFRALSSKTLAS